MRILSLIEKPEKGEIYYRGKKVTNPSEALSIRRRFSCVFQKPILFQGTVRQNLMLAVKLKSQKSEREDMDSVLEFLGVEHLLDQEVGTLSGGESRKVALAMAMVTDPELLLLDEPTAFLDAKTKTLFDEELLGLLKSMKATVVYVTHDRSEALSFGEKLVLMHKGEVIQAGPVEEVFNFPASLEAANLTGSFVVASGMVDKVSEGIAEVSLSSGVTVLVTPNGSIKGGERVNLTIRPDTVVISIKKEEFTSAKNVFKARVKRVRKTDGVLEVFIDAGFPLKSFLTAESARNLGIKAGAEVYASIKATSINLIKTPERSE